MTGGCCFSVCSLITDVRESVSDMPREPDEIKKLLMENFGLGGSKPASTDTKAGAGAGTGATKTETGTMFKHPISYTDPTKLHELPGSIIEDLEMIQPKSATTILRINRIQKKRQLLP